MDLVKEQPTQNPSTELEPEHKKKVSPSTPSPKGCRNNECKKCDKEDRIREEYDCRPLFSHMILSHLFIVFPALWWIFGPNAGSFESHVVDKLLSVTLTIAILISLIYHYYYECVLCNVEEPIMQVGLIVLNIYMLYRGVPYVYIAAGLIFLIILQIMVTAFTYTNNPDEIYELYHPFCHYMAGIYIAYCVYFIRKTF